MIRFSGDWGSAEVGWHLAPSSWFKFISGAGPLGGVWGVLRAFCGPKGTGEPHLARLARLALQLIHQS